MGKIYINCSRCGKDLECEELCDVYTSKIDDSFICKDCYKKEKPDYIQQLKQQLDEKDKEIEELKLKLDIRAISLQNINTERIESERSQTQLAIQELAEVERLLYESHYKEIDNRYYAEYEDIKNLIDSRIKALEKRDV